MPSSSKAAGGTFPIIVNCPSCGKRREVWAYVIVAIDGREVTDPAVWYTCDCGAQIDIRGKMAPFLRESAA